MFVIKPANISNSNELSVHVGYLLFLKLLTEFPQILAIPQLNASFKIIAPLRRKYLKQSPLHPSRHLLFLLSPPRQDEVESDLGKLISDKFRL